MICVEGKRGKWSLGILEASALAKGHAALCGPLIGSILKANYGIPLLQLLFGEGSLVLDSFLWAESFDAKFGRLPTNCLQAYLHRVKVHFLPQIDCLEAILNGHTDNIETEQEGVDIVHALECHRCRWVELLDGAILDGVQEPVDTNR